jgi:hypothetical protein
MRSCADVARQRPVLPLCADLRGERDLPLYRIRPIVPVVVLAQTWRGGPQHQISRVLQGCDILPDDQRDLTRIADSIGVKIRTCPT